MARHYQCELGTLRRQDGWLFAEENGDGSLCAKVEVGGDTYKKKANLINRLGYYFGLVDISDLETLAKEADRATWATPPSPSPSVERSTSMAKHQVVIAKPAGIRMGGDNGAALAPVSLYKGIEGSSIKIKKCASGVLSALDIIDQFGDDPRDLEITDTITTLDFGQQGVPKEVLSQLFYIFPSLRSCKQVHAKELLKGGSDNATGQKLMIQTSLDLLHALSWRMIRCCPALEALSLQHNAMYNEGLERLTAPLFSSLGHLQVINVGDCGLSDGNVLRNALSAVKTLKWLVISRNNFVETVAFDALGGVLTDHQETVEGLECGSQKNVGGANEGTDFTAFITGICQLHPTILKCLSLNELNVGSDDRLPEFLSGCSMQLEDIGVPNDEKLCNIFGALSEKSYFRFLNLELCRATSNGELLPSSDDLGNDETGEGCRRTG